MSVYQRISLCHSKSRPTFVLFTEFIAFVGCMAAMVGLSFVRELLRIPFGETRSYGDVAAELGKPGASRAVGMANHNNPIAIVVPCHRVVGSDGSLTGYAGGIHLKQQLLSLEQRSRTLFT